jgi:periplasmic protein TonB
MQLEGRPAHLETENGFPVFRLMQPFAPEGGTMFEQAVLSERPPAARYWAAVIGITGQLLLVACILIAPLIWPQLLPQATVLTWLTLPAPIPAAVKTAPPVHIRPTRPFQVVGDKLVQPVSIPDTIAIIDDPPLAESAGPIAADIASGLAGLAAGVLNQAIRSAPIAPAPATPAAAPSKPSASAPIIRVRQGGLVNPARIVQRLEPVYPLIARQARISGTVELEGIIGIDGRIRELRVLSGHPLLTKAALDAVRHWVYEPTRLNGQPVEVIAPITVHFRLN